MAIKIIPEKVSHIDKHKTRKKITNSTYAYKELISRASHLSSSLDVANKELKKFDIPYLNDADIIYYSPEKLIFQSDREILKFKFRELSDQFITKLKQNRLFSKLKKIEIIIDYKAKESVSKINAKSLNRSKAYKALEQIKKNL
jgi:hypothetical protein